VSISLHLHNLSFFSLYRYCIAIVIVVLLRFFAPSFRLALNVVFSKDILIHIQSIVACRSIQGCVLQQLVHQAQAACPLEDALFVHLQTWTSGVCSIQFGSRSLSSTGCVAGGCKSSSGVCVQNCL